ncbi:helix-turn-helix domain-containing protein [Flagellimonas aurea]|uniref:helix-turn-helix domain-containing protein n=1 Tax=Flagellimonas aurea TaxID=2915619 RepID=UPI0035CF8A54
MNFLNIKEQIKSNGYTYESFGAKVGMSKASIARIASGNQTPSFETLEKLANALDIEVIDLFKSKKGYEEPNGYVEYLGEVHKITSMEDLKNLIDKQ